MNFVWYIVTVVVITLEYKQYNGDASAIPSLGKCGKVHLTVSSLKDNYLELNWITKCESHEEIPDTIAIYNKAPTAAKKPLQSINALNYTGYFLTSVKFVKAKLPAEWSYYENATGSTTGPYCLPYWIASIKERKIIDTNCLSIQPHWMDNHRSVLGLQTIGTIFIPGTHNSGAYGKVSRFLKNFVLNQDSDIWTQLVFGIRYLDFRIGYFHGEGFFINHDVINISELVPQLRMITHFLKLAPKEIIIIDFHQFPYPENFDKKIHKKLIRVIRRELGEFALPSRLQVGEGPTLQDIWKQNKQLIICYGEKEIAKKYTWLWGPLEQYWGDKQDVTDLKNFMEVSIKTHKSGHLWALMAELTISIGQIIRFYSNRHLADATNRELSKWFRDEWAKEANIVATDYFLGNDLINIAIESNKLRSKKIVFEWNT